MLEVAYIAVKAHLIEQSDEFYERKVKIGNLDAL
jgi:hypothetical protein